MALEVHQPALEVVDLGSDEDAGLSPNLTPRSDRYLSNDDITSTSSNEPTVSGSIVDSISSNQQHDANIVTPAQREREHAVDSGSADASTNSIIRSQQDTWDWPSTWDRRWPMPTEHIGTLSSGEETTRLQHTATSQQHWSAEGHVSDSTTCNTALSATSRCQHGATLISTLATHGQDQITAINAITPATMSVHMLSSDDQRQAMGTSSAATPTMTVHSRTFNDQHQTTASNVTALPPKAIHLPIFCDQQHAAVARSSTSHHHWPSEGSSLLPRSTINSELHSENSMTSHYQDTIMAPSLATSNNQQLTRDPNTLTSLHHLSTATSNSSHEPETMIMQAGDDEGYHLNAATDQEGILNSGAAFCVSASSTSPTASHASHASHSLTSGRAPFVSIHVPKSGTFSELSAASSGGDGTVVETKRDIDDRDGLISSFQGSVVPAAPHAASSSSTPYTRREATPAATSSGSPTTSGALAFQHYAVPHSRSHPGSRRRSRSHSCTRSQSRSYSRSQSHSRSRARARARSHLRVRSRSRSRLHLRSRPRSHSRLRMRSRSGIGAEEASGNWSRRHSREGRDSTTSTPQEVVVTHPSSSSIVTHSPFLNMDNAHELPAFHLVTTSSSAFQEPTHPSTSSSNHAPRSPTVFRPPTTTLGSILPLEGVNDATLQSITPSHDAYRPASSSSDSTMVVTALPTQEPRSLRNEVRSSARARSSSSDRSVISLMSESFPEEPRHRSSIISLEDSTPPGNADNQRLAATQTRDPLVSPQAASLAPNTSDITPARQAHRVSVVNLLDADDSDIRTSSSDLASVPDRDSAKLGASPQRGVHKRNRPAASSQAELRPPPSEYRLAAHWQVLQPKASSASSSGLPDRRLPWQQHYLHSRQEREQRSGVPTTLPQRWPHRHNNDAAYSDAPPQRIPHNTNATSSDASSPSRPRRHNTDAASSDTPSARRPLRHSNHAASFDAPPQRRPRHHNNGVASSDAPPPRRPRRHNNDAASSDAPLHRSSRRNNGTASNDAPPPRPLPLSWLNDAAVAALNRTLPGMMEEMTRSFMAPPHAISQVNHERRPSTLIDNDSDTHAGSGGDFSSIFSGSIHGFHSNSDSESLNDPYDFADTDSDADSVRLAWRSRRRQPPTRSQEGERLLRRAERRWLALASGNNFPEEFAHIQGGPPIEVDDVEILSDGNNELGTRNGNGDARDGQESAQDAARERWLCSLRDVKYEKTEEPLGYDDLQTALPILLNDFKQISLASVKAALDQTKSYANAYFVLEEIVRSNRPGELLAKKRTKQRWVDISKASPNLRKQLAAPDFEKKVQALMDQYASDRRKAIEEGNNATCGCCFDEELMQTEVLKCSQSHSFCYACVRKGAEAFFGEGLYASEPGQGNWSMCVVRCMKIGGCEGTFSEATLQEALPQASYLRYSQRALALSAAIANVEDLVFCPWCDFVVSMPNQNDCIVECRNPICGKKSCRWCKQKSHIPLRCDEVEKDWEVEIRTRIEEAINDVLGRRCPTCEKIFEKTHGCNHMTCVCGTNFCYLCGAVIRRNATDVQTGKYHYGRKPLCDQFGELSKTQKREMKQRAKVAAIAARDQFLKEHPEHKGKTLKHCPIEALQKE